MCFFSLTRKVAKQWRRQRYQWTYNIQCTNDDQMNEWINNWIWKESKWPKRNISLLVTIYEGFVEMEKEYYSNESMYRISCTQIFHSAKMWEIWKPPPKQKIIKRDKWKRTQPQNSGFVVIATSATAAAAVVGVDLQTKIWNSLFTVRF